MKSRGAGGGDHQTIPLCSAPDFIDGHHDEVHRGKKEFEKKYWIDQKQVAFALWAESPANEIGIHDTLEEDFG